MSNVTAPSAVRRAEGEVAALLGACIDYQKLLDRLSIADPVAGHVEHLMTKYKVAIPPRSKYGERPIKTVSSI